MEELLLAKLAKIEKIVGNKELSKKLVIARTKKNLTGVATLRKNKRGLEARKFNRNRCCNIKRITIEVEVA